MDRINPQNVNIVTKNVPVATAAASSVRTTGAGDTYFQIGSLPPIPRWVGVAVVAATTALGAAGCYYYFYSRRQQSPKTAGSSDNASLQDLKTKGNEFFKKDDFAGALDCYTKAIQCRDRSPEQLAILYQNRAAVFEKLGDKLQVINECTCALKYQPNYVKALTRRAKAYKDTGFLEQALEDITTACTLDQYQHGSTVQLIDEIVKELGVKEAKKIFKLRQPSEPSRQFIITFLRAYQEDPVSKAWMSGKAKNDNLQNHNSVNGDDSKNTSNSVSGYSLAIDQLKSDKFSNIIQLCTDEISNPLSPVLLDAYLLRGTFKHLYGYKSTEVVEDFKMILEDSTSTNQLRVSAWIKTGLSLFNWSWDNNEKNWQEAFENAAKLNPKNPDVYFQWGQMLLFKGEFNESMSKLSQAVDCSQTFPLAEATRSFLKYRLALINENSVEMGQAFMEFETLQKKWPECPEIFAFYGQILMEMQRFDEALGAFDQVAKVDPGHTNAVVHRVLCKAQRSGGLDNLDSDALVKELRDSLTNDPKNGFVWETIASVEVQAGNKDKANEAIAHAIECARTFPEIAMLSSLKVGIEMQFKVKEKLNTT